MIFSIDLDVTILIIIKIKLQTIHLLSKLRNVLNLSIKVDTIMIVQNNPRANLKKLKLFNDFLKLFCKGTISSNEY